MEEKVLEMLMSAQFDWWYQNQFMDFVEGSENPPTEEEILAGIRSMLKENCLTFSNN